MRKTILLNDDWYFTKAALPPGDAEENWDGPGNAAFDAILRDGEAVTLPHTWNARDGQDGGNDYYRGRCWYMRRLEAPKLEPEGEAWLEFCGAAMTAEVYFNGKKLAVHQGGYSAFRVNVTDFLQKENLLAVSVDNSDNDQVYPQKADFTFYGGLYREVKLICVPGTHFELGYRGGQGIRVTPRVDPKKRTAEVTVETWQTGKGQVTVTLNGQSQTAAAEGGYARTEFFIENVHLWDGPEDPYLYTAQASLWEDTKDPQAAETSQAADTVSVRFGCRKFEIDPQKGFLLNGRSFPLRGVSRHQDRKGAGNALTLEMHREDMALVREIGANTLRLAHYQHAQEFYDLCDENGIVVWAEIPYITMHMKNGLENTLSQMEELVVQCCNHPSIAVWGLSNEITAASVVDEALLDNHRRLNELCHRLDPSRPTTMANVFMLEIDSPILEIPDVNSYNLYFGWYLGELEQNDEFFDEYHARYPDRCIGFSEYGADANPGFQSPAPEKGDYTEGYQALYHEHMLDMIEKRPWLWAAHVWNMFDFAADGRDEGGKHGENQKGLVTFDRKTKKDAFYLYKAAWNRKEPFVHLCGSRYVDRAEEITEIKVYSNQNQVSLFVDGELAGSQKGKTVFRFEVPLRGEHVIEARAGEYTDRIRVRRVETPNLDYQYNKQGNVVNWFDQEEIDPSCFSVSDTLAELRSNPRAGAIIEEMMARGAASRGDVAESVKDNPALQRMMGRMTLISLLKQGGMADEESVKQLNRILQQIRKE
ncbi:MAG: glycoside hydrolase family 2 protein [Acetatifactor sp.]|nr:glycoside hydrolase family 2 protein [Acetatifactor sp.]